MAKTTGIGERLFVNQYDLSGDIGALGTISASRNQQDVTVLPDSAMERLGLLRDGHLGFHAFFDVAAGQEHPVLKSLPQSALFTWCTGTTAGNPTGSLVANTSAYNPTRGADGSLAVDITADANGYGIQWGNLLTNGLQTFASSGSGTYIDDYVPSFGSLPLPSAHGLAAYLHVYSVGSGTATVHVQDSTDHISFSDITGMVFTAATGATSQRIQSASTTQAVNRYLRINVTGTFTDAVLAVSVVRYITEFAA